jgi:hypothetical protein
VRRPVERGLAQNPIDRFPSLRVLVDQLRSPPRPVIGVWVGAPLVCLSVAAAVDDTSPSCEDGAVTSAFEASEIAEESVALLDAAIAARPETESSVAWRTSTASLLDRVREIKEESDETCRVRPDAPSERIVARDALLCLERRSDQIAEFASSLW